VRSEVLYSTEQTYIDETTEFVELYDGAFLQMFGRGEGTVIWGDKRGRVEWTNFPTRRPDGVYLPDITGVIKLDRSDHPIMYRLQGISLLPDDNDRRLFAGPVRWYTADPGLLWLNDLWGYEEGELDGETLGFRTIAYGLHPDPPRAHP
jgi:hypothetical protein